jgi:AraC-like DNA-binding protein
MHNALRPGPEPLHVPVRPEIPSLLMMFPLQGRAGLVGQGWETELVTHQQMFDIFPVGHSVLHMPAHSAVQSIVIEIELNTPILDEVIQGDDNERSALLYRAVAKGESLHRQRESLRIDHLTAATLYEMLHCPYSGKMRAMYLESQTKLLLIHQLDLVTRLRKKSSTSSDSKLSRTDTENLYALRQYPEEHFLEVHSLLSLTRQFGLNLFKLKYGFKKLFGHSVMKWLDDKKLLYAHTLLMRENASVFDVATQLNYQHPNNFSAAFKRKFGHSPQGLRKT